MLALAPNRVTIPAYAKGRAKVIMIELAQVNHSVFMRALETNLSRLAAPRKVWIHFLEAVQLRLPCDSAELYIRDDSGQLTPVMHLGQAGLCDASLILDFAKRKRPEIPHNRLLSFIKMRDDIVGVICIAKESDDFALGEGRILKKLATILGRDIERRHEERLQAVIDRIKDKIINELRPGDLAYQILDGLEHLIHYDHSSAFLTHDLEQGALHVAAEKVVWTKTKSGYVGHKIPLESASLAAFKQMGDMRIFEANETEGAPDDPMREILIYNRGKDIPKPWCVVCAPIYFDGEFLGLLKIANWRRPSFSHAELDAIRRFLPLAAVSLRNAKVKMNLEDRAIEAEMQQGLITLARAVAHDVNNAIGAILPIAKQIQEDLTENCLDEDVLRQDLDVIVTKANLCKRIFSNMLQAGVERSGSGPLDANHLIRDMQPMLEAQVGANPIELGLHLDPNLPLVYCSKLQLERIVWNLVTNAIEALGEGPGTVVLRTERKDQYTVLLIVSDDGPGIPQHLLDKVQEPFFTTKPRGTGLGLSISRSLAWQYGGGFRIKSEPGKGTMVTVELRTPRAKMEAEDNA